MSSVYPSLIGNTLAVIKRHIPLPVKRKYRWLHSYLTKDLLYLEMHLTEHCNLNCKGCGHCSPLAPHWYADITQYRQDLRRLREIFRNIRRIHLMGGEPLLHPTPELFISATRSCFPKAAIAFVTNGILLPKASVAFWETCRIENASIRVSGYPIQSVDEEQIRALAKTARVDLVIGDAPKNGFMKPLNLAGNSDKRKMFDLCGTQCVNLKQGRLHRCPISAYIEHFNSQFGYQIEADKVIDIYSGEISMRTILSWFSKPIETCRWCMLPCAAVAPWSKSTANQPPSAADWDAGAAENTVYNGKTIGRFDLAANQE